MSIVRNKTDILLKKKSISYYKLGKLTDYDVSYLNNIFKGKRTFPEKLINKILPVLEVSREEFESWILADKYPKETIRLAIEAKKAKGEDKKLIITAKVDEFLQSKGLSRTEFAKQIKHSQSSFNNAVTGKEPLSEKLMIKISSASNIPIEQLQAWILADKYSLKLLKLAAEC